MHGLADGQTVWSATRHRRGTVAHTRVITAGVALALVTWDGSLDCDVLTPELVATLHRA